MTDRIVLRRDGWKNLTIRNRNGEWQILEYTDHYGGERWVKIKLSEADILRNIETYHERMSDHKPRRETLSAK